MRTPSWSRASSRIATYCGAFSDGRRFEGGRNGSGVVGCRGCLIILEGRVLVELDAFEFGE